MDFLSTFLIVFLVIALAVPGFALKKAKLLPGGASNALAVLLLYVAQPFLMVSSLLNKTFTPSLLPDFAAVALFAAGLQLMLYFLSKLFFVKVKEEPTRRICVASSYLGNVGFMGIPVMKALFPSDDTIILYTVIFNIVFNAMTWTLAVYAITGDKSKIKPVKILLNPPTIATVLALPFFFCNVSVPDNVLTTIGYLGDMTLPLSMVILGIRLADIKFTRLFTSAPVYGVALVKLVVSPLAALGVMLLVRLLIPVETTVIVALFIIFAMPSASSALNFAEMYGGDCDTAAKATLTNTLLCVLTIPILSLLIPLL